MVPSHWPVPVARMYLVRRFSDGDRGWRGERLQFVTMNVPGVAGWGFIV